MRIWNKIKKQPRLALVILAYVAFIALGMPDGLLGIAWPSIRATFSLRLDAVGMLLTASVSGYMTSSFLSGPLIARTGVGRVLAASCALTGAALIGYTLVPAWGWMVALGVIAGLGAGAIDSGLNAYVAAHFGEGLMQWLHASYGIGVTLGPVIMTTALARLHAWQPGYRAVGSVQLILAACFLATLHWWSREEGARRPDGTRRLTEYRTSFWETLRQPRVWLSALLFFLYVGAESALGTWTFSLLSEGRGIEPEAAGWWAGSYWATFTIGRVAAGLAVHRVRPRALVSAGLAGALLGALLLAWDPTPGANLLAVALLGFSIAPLFPAFMSETSQRVGARFAANTIGMQMAATGLGVAVIPSLVGVLARQYSLEIIPIFMLILFGGLLAVDSASRTVHSQ